jgi:hypothetical protein
MLPTCTERDKRSKEKAFIVVLGCREFETKTKSFSTRRKEGRRRKTANPNTIRTSQPPEAERETKKGV